MKKTANLIKKHQGIILDILAAILIIIIFIWLGFKGFIGFCLGAGLMAYLAISDNKIYLKLKATSETLSVLRRIR